MTNIENKYSVSFEELAEYEKNVSRQIHKHNAYRWVYEKL